MILAACCIDATPQIFASFEAVPLKQKDRPVGGPSFLVERVLGLPDRFRLPLPAPAEQT